MVKEFKEFISRGSVMDLAVGVIIGGAFGKIVTSLVNDVIMPFIGVILGGLNFTDLILTIGDSKIMYGLFIQNVIDFLIIALVIFIMIKLLNKFNKKEKPKEVKPVASVDTKLLEEIRDILKKKK